MKRALVISIAIGAIFIPLLMAHAHASSNAPFRDIGAIAVLVEPLGDVGRKAGITEEELKAFVELKLRQAGIPVRTIEKYVFEGPRLDVNVTLMYLERRDHIVYSASIKLKQTVRLLRNNDFVTAATWERGFIGSVPRNEARNTVKNNIDSLMTFFLNSYLEENPGIIHSR